MKRTVILTTCLTSCVVTTGCDKTRPTHEVPVARSESVEMKRDPSVSARVRKEVGGILGKSPDSIKVTDAFVRDLGADSLDTVEIVMATEEAFGIAITDEDAGKLVTVGDLIDYVSAKIKNAPVTSRTAVPPKTGANEFPMSVGERVKVVATFVSITSGTDELDFDWIVKPFTVDPPVPFPQDPPHPQPGR